MNMFGCYDKKMFFCARIRMDENYPLHRLVWRDEVDKLTNSLKNQQNLEVDFFSMGVPTLEIKSCSHIGNHVVEWKN